MSVFPFYVKSNVEMASVGEAKLLSAVNEISRSSSENVKTKGGKRKDSSSSSLCLQEQHDKQLDHSRSHNCNDDEINDVTRKEEQLTWRDIIKQILIGCAIHSVSLQTGIIFSFSAVLLPQLAAEYNATKNNVDKDEEDVIRFDTDIASWIASLMTLSLPLGALIVGGLIDKFGRKKIAMLTTVPFTISWLMHYWAGNVNVIYGARIISGFGAGLSTSVCLIYVAEVAHAKLRAMLLNLISLFACLGILITCAIGPVLHWRTMSICFAALSISSCLAIFVLPESPHWLHFFKGKTAEATKILSRLYSNDRVFQIEQRRLLDNQLVHQSESCSNIFQSLRQPNVFKPLIILLILFTLQQLTGCYVVIFYAVDIFKRIGSGMDEYKALIVFGAIRFVAAIVSTVTSIKIGRKIVLVATISGMVVSALGAALTTGLLTSWCVLGYVAFGSIGVLVIPWTLMGEMLPMKVRGTLGSFLLAVAYLLMFGIVKSFPYLVEIVEMRLLFYCLVGINLFMIYFVIAWMPETLGKSFRQIEEYFLK